MQYLKAVAVLTMGLAVTVGSVSAVFLFWCVIGIYGLDLGGTLTKPSENTTLFMIGMFFVTFILIFAAFAKDDW